MRTASKTKLRIGQRTRPNSPNPKDEPMQRKLTRGSRSAPAVSACVGAPPIVHSRGFTQTLFGPTSPSRGSGRRFVDTDPRCQKSSPRQVRGRESTIGTNDEHVNIKDLHAGRPWRQAACGGGQRDAVASVAPDNAQDGGDRTATRRSGGSTDFERT